MSKPAAKMKEWVKDANQTLRRSLHTSSSASNTATYSGTVTEGGGRYAGAAFNKQWVHPPEHLQLGRVEYTVKFLGECEVSQSKGVEVIREAIQKLRFRLQVNRSAQGTAAAKLPKTELHINVDGLTVVDAKTKVVMYKYALHRISFCADDKNDKRVFAFIAKRSDVEVHDCFVFLSEKMAEEITLTIGEAFDLAYRKFLEHNGRDLEVQKQLYQLRQRVQQLEQENTQLRQRLGLQQQLGGRDGAPVAQAAWETFQKLTPPTETPPDLPKTPIPKKPTNLGTTAAAAAAAVVRLPPPTDSKPTTRSQSQTGSGSGATTDDEIFDDTFDPRADEKKQAAVSDAAQFYENGTAAPTGSTTNGSTSSGTAVVALRKSSTGATDVFGQEPFSGDSPTTSGTQQQQQQQQQQQKAANSVSNKELVVRDSIAIPDTSGTDFETHVSEMRQAFERGLGIGGEESASFGAGDLLTDFDPLVQAGNNTTSAPAEQ